MCKGPHRQMSVLNYVVTKRAHLHFKRHTIVLLASYVDVCQYMIPKLTRHYVIDKDVYAITH